MKKLQNNAFILLLTGIIIGLVTQTLRLFRVRNHEFNDRLADFVQDPARLEKIQRFFIFILSFIILMMIILIVVFLVKTLKNKNTPRSQTYIVVLLTFTIIFIIMQIFMSFKVRISLFRIASLTSCILIIVGSLIQLKSE